MVISTPSQSTQFKAALLANAVEPIDVIVDGIVTLVNPVCLNISCPNPKRPFINATLVRLRIS
jgi:hypothetical protein